MTSTYSDTKTDTDNSYCLTLTKSSEISNYFNYIPNKIEYAQVTIDCSSYDTNEGNNVLYYDTIISTDTVLVIKENSKFVIKRSLKNYGTIINNGRIIVDIQDSINSYFANDGDIINNGSFEIYGSFQNLDRGSIISSKMIKNYGIFSNDGIIENNKLFINEGIFNNNNKLIINGEMTNSYIFHNKKNIKKIIPNIYINDNVPEINSIVTNNGKITNTHIIHNETLIINTNYNAFSNFNIIINTGIIEKTGNFYSCLVAKKKHWFNFYGFNNLFR